MGSLGINEGLLAVQAPLFAAETVPAEEIASDAVADDADSADPLVSEPRVYFASTPSIALGDIGSRARRFGEVTALMAAVPALPQATEPSSGRDYSVFEGIGIGLGAVIGVVVLLRAIMNSITPEEYARFLKEDEPDSDSAPAQKQAEVGAGVSPRG